MGTTAPLLIYRICHEFTNRTELRLYVLTRHKTGAVTKDIIHEMTQVHGQDNLPSQKTVYRWIQDIKNGIWLGKKKERRNLELNQCLVS